MRSVRQEENNNESFRDPAKKVCKHEARLELQEEKGDDFIDSSFEFGSVQSLVTLTRLVLIK